MATVFKIDKNKQRHAGDWHGKVRLSAYQFRRVRLCSDKGISEAWLHNLQAAVDRQAAGEPPRPEQTRDIPRRLLEALGLTPSKLAIARGKTWAQHVEDYVQELRTAGRNAVYAANAEHYLKEIGATCVWKRLTDSNRDDFAKFIESRKANGAAARTLNNIRSTALSFLKWAVMARRADHNDLQALGRVDEKAAVKKRVRRALMEKECVALVAAAGERELIYRLALGSGLRHRELRLLEWRDVRVDGEYAARPYLALRPEATKSKRADEVPLSEDLARRLREARPRFCTPIMQVFKRLPRFNQWKDDLRAAGIAYKDSQNRICGFHSLRVTLGTELERIGCPRAVRHWIMRHSDPSVSYQSYVDRQRLDAWEWANQLPTYPLPEAAALRRTGTAGGQAPKTTPNTPQIGPNTGHFGGRPWHRMARDDAKRAVGSACGDGASAPVNTGDLAPTGTDCHAVGITAAKRSRTSTILRSLGPEPSASANSAMAAALGRPAIPPRRDGPPVPRYTQAKV
jgi:integrase